MKLRGWKSDNEDIRKTFAEEEIVVKDLFSVFWRRRLIIGLIIAFFFIIAILKVSTTPYDYLAVSTYISEAANSSELAAGGFAELLGFGDSKVGGQGLGTFSDPGFYPAIISSQPFLQDLMEESFYFNSYGREMTLKEFARLNDERDLVTKVTSPVTAIIRQFFALFEKKPSPPTREMLRASSDSTQIDRREFDAAREVLLIGRSDQSAMTVIASQLEISAEGSLIRIHSRMPDPIVAAQLNKVVSKKLLEFIVTNETEKERRDLEFVERRVQSAKENFEKSQRALAQFRDRNRGVVSATVSSEEDKLQSAFSIDFGIYQKLATDLEEKRIALEEKTPILTVFEPAYVPLEPESKDALRTFVVFVLLGFFLGLATIGIVILRSITKP